MKMIIVKPAAGFRILNPYNSFAEVPREGLLTPDDAFWRKRAAEGGIEILDPNAPAEPAPEAAPTPKARAAKS